MRRRDAELRLGLFSRRLTLHYHSPDGQGRFGLSASIAARRKSSRGEGAPLVRARRFPRKLKDQPNSSSSLNIHSILREQGTRCRPPILTDVEMKQSEEHSACHPNCKSRSSPGSVFQPPQICTQTQCITATRVLFNVAPMGPNSTSGFLG